MKQTQDDSTVWLAAAQMDYMLPVYLTEHAWQQAHVLCSY